MSKNLVLLINAHQPYITNQTDEFITENELLFSSISHTYLPLLRVLSRLKNDQIPCKIALVLSPILCELLSDPIMQAKYITWAHKFLAFAESELERTKNNPAMQEIAKIYHAEIVQNIHDFTEKYNQNLLTGFSQFAKEGYIELLATAGTNCFLPLYQDLPEVINAQIEVGLISHKHFFGTLPEGFWLPYMGYYTGLEKTLKSYGLSYSIANTHSFLFANPFLKTGIFAPVKSDNNFIFLANGIDFSDTIMTKKGGLIHHSVYCDPNHDVGYEHDESCIKDILSPNKARFSTGFCYHAKKSVQTIYNKESATVQAQRDALTFFTQVEQKLTEAQNLLPEEKSVTAVCCLDAYLLGVQWREGLEWLEALCRLTHEKKSLTLQTPATVIDETQKFQRTHLYPSSNLKDGYSEDFLDSQNTEIFSSVWQESSRMIDIAKRFEKTFSIKEKALNSAAKQLLLAQSSDWPKMIKDDFYTLFAKEQFLEHINSFIDIYNSLGSNTLNAEKIIHQSGATHIFPWINYRIFSPKITS
ncbi:MAG: 1,4-alpha-glucan branching protein domain-containing protein [Treponemataceae bacterium]